MTPDPLPPELDELLQSARPLEGAPKDARDRLARRIALSVAAPAALAGGAAAITRAASSGKGTLSPLAQKIAIGVASFALGGGVGAAVHAALAPEAVVLHAPASAPLMAAATAPTIAAPANIPTVAVGDLPASPSASIVAARPPAPSAIAAPSSSAAGLAEERRLLDGARSALSRGEPASAIAPLDEHERRFPGGVLTEEREALAIQALARSGHTREAEERAARFEKAFPQSLMMSAVRDALGATRNPP